MSLAPAGIQLGRLEPRSTTASSSSLPLTPIDVNRSTKTRGERGKRVIYGHYFRMQEFTFYINGTEEMGQFHPRVFCSKLKWLLQRSVFHYRVLASRCHFPFVEAVPSFP